MEAALRVQLVGTAAVTALIGSAMYWLAADQDATAPMLVYQRITSSREGNQTGADGLVNATFQIDCYGTSQQTAMELADAVRTAIDGRTGTFGSGGNTATVDYCRLEDERDVEEAPSAGEETRVFRRMLEFRIKYCESIPSFA